MTPKSLSSSSSRVRPPDSTPTRPRGIPVRTSGSGSTGDTTPRSSSSKESSPSPRSSVYGEVSKIPISRSQEDLIRSVHLRSCTQQQQQLLPRSQSSSVRCSTVSPRGSGLLSAGSLELLSSLDSSRSQVSPEKPSVDPRLGQSSSAIRPSPPPKPSSLTAPSSTSRIPPPAVSKVPAKLTVTPSYGANRSKPVGASSPRVQRALEKSIRTPKPVTGNQTPRTGIQSPRTARRDGPRGPVNSLHNSSLDVSKNGSSVAADMIGKDYRKVPLGKGGSSKRKLLKTEAEQVLKDQLSRGKVPPKAKFRADDEISIGEPSETRTVTTPLRRSVPEARVENVATVPSPEDAKFDAKRDSSVERESPERRLLPESDRTSRIHSLPTPSLLPNRRLLGRSSSSSGKSCSLDHHYSGRQPAKVTKSSGSNFFQRISSLRQSLTERRSPSKITPHTTTSDTGFFQGIHTTPRHTLAPYEVRHGPNLVVPPLFQLRKAPPKRNRARCVVPPRGGVQRSLSFTDAQLIAQAVTEGDNRFLEDFYPTFPLAEKVYTVIRARKEPEERMVKPSFLEMDRPAGGGRGHLYPGKENGYKGNLNLSNSTGRNKHRGNFLNFSRGEVSP